MSSLFLDDAEPSDASEATTNVPTAPTTNHEVLRSWMEAEAPDGRNCGTVPVPTKQKQDNDPNVLGQRSDHIRSKVQSLEMSRAVCSLVQDRQILWPIMALGQLNTMGDPVSCQGSWLLVDGHHGLIPLVSVAPQKWCLWPMVVNHCYMFNLKYILDLDQSLFDQPSTSTLSQTYTSTHVPWFSGLKGHVNCLGKHWTFETRQNRDVCRQDICSSISQPMFLPTFDEAWPSQPWHTWKSTASVGSWVNTSSSQVKLLSVHQ